MSSENSEVNTSWNVNGNPFTEGDERIMRNSVIISVPIAIFLALLCLCYSIRKSNEDDILPATTFCTPVTSFSFSVGNGREFTRSYWPVSSITSETPPSIVLGNSPRNLYRI